MQQHIDINQLIQLSPAKVFSLANNETISLNYFAYDSVEEVEKVIEMSKKSGIVHSTLKFLAKQCNIGYLIALLNSYGEFKIENVMSNSQIYYIVIIKNGNEQNEVGEFTYTADELCAALWSAVSNHVL